MQGWHWVAPAHGPPQRESIRFGRKVTRPGKAPSMATARISRPKKGAADFVTVHMSRPLIPCSTKRLKPTGGVIWAISIKKDDSIFLQAEKKISSSEQEKMFPH